MASGNLHETLSNYSLPGNVSGVSVTHGQPRRCHIVALCIPAGRAGRWPSGAAAERQHCKPLTRSRNWKLSGLYEKVPIRDGEMQFRPGLVEDVFHGSVNRGKQNLPIRQHVMENEHNQQSLALVT